MRFLVPTPPDFSLAETLASHGWRRLLPFVWHEETQTIARAEEMPTGSVASLWLSAGEGAVQVEVEGSDDEAEVVRRIRRMLQLDLPMADFHAYCRTLPELAPVAEYRRGRLLRCPTLWEDVVKVIATTNTTWGQTIAMSARLVEAFGAEGRTFPTAQRIAAAPFEEFAAKARMGYRNAYVHKIAQAIAASTLDLEAWQGDRLSATELRRHLLSLPGVGPYGAACLMLYLGQPAHVNSDSVARALVAQEMGRPVTDKDVHAFFEAHGKWRGLVYNFYPWRGG